jgi:methionyl-tRNA formyltransferase
VRAFDPRPGAFTTLRGAEVKLFGARSAPVAGEGVVGAPGEVLTADAAGLLVACGTGALRLLEAQPAGKRRLTAAEWARGRGVAVGDRFGG